MKKSLLHVLFVVIFFTFCTISASAVVNDTVKVGLKYGSGALSAANLENAEGAGYALGYFEEDRSFTELGFLDETTITMNAVSGEYHVQLDRSFSSFEEAADAAGEYGGYPAYINGEFVVRVGIYASRSEALSAGLSGQIVLPSTTAVRITRTNSAKTLFEFDESGLLSLGVLPNGGDGVTWFKGYRYRGGFEYRRASGGNLNVINVVDLEDYVKGVVPYEMSGNWPDAALEAQAVCVRTFACDTVKHQSTYGFDVCNTTDCQVYYGMGSSANPPTEASNRAVDATAGECLYYEDKLIQAVYCSSDGGATESAVNVWGGNYGYLIGKEDPFESSISIPNYTWSVTYTADELTYILQNKDYKIGTVKNVYVSEFTEQGNVAKVTFTDTAGKTVTVKGDTCRTVFYSSTYGKSVRSLRFTVNGAGAPAGGIGSSGGYYVNGSGSQLDSLGGVCVISGSGTVGTLKGAGASAITASGTQTLSGGTSAQPAAAAPDDGTFTITGSGYGHNVGLSQYGAYAMAMQGYSCDDILNFYYTNVSIY